MFWWFALCLWIIRPWIPIVFVGDYHDVCSHYDIDSFQVAAVYEKHDGGPSKALLEHLAASHEQLTVAEFARVLRKIAKRGDIAKILEEYDNQ